MTGISTKLLGLNFYNLSLFRKFEIAIKKKKPKKKLIKKTPWVNPIYNIVTFYELGLKTVVIYLNDLKFSLRLKKKTLKVTADSSSL